MEESVGSVVYEVKSDTAGLLKGGAAGEKALDDLQKGFAATDKAAQKTSFQMTKTASAVQQLSREASGASGALGGLSRMIGGLVTLQAANGLIQMAEAYNEMGERVRMASSSQAEYEMVQARLLKTANATYRSMAEAQEVYILTADTLRAMGYNTSQALDITDSLSFAFVKNATTVDRAKGAIQAYTNSIMKGRVEADSWATVVAAVPTIIGEIAKATGRSSEEIRKMGAEGKLTAAMLNEGLRQSLESNREAANGMATTVKDAFTALRNNLAAYIGESNNASGATGVLSKAILFLGENIKSIVDVLAVAGAGALARYVAQLGIKTVATMRDIAATRAAAAAELQLATAQVAATGAGLADGRAQTAAAAGHVAARQAVDAHAAAQVRLAAAQRAASAAGLGIVGLLGGPVGLITLAASVAAGMYLFSDGTTKARQTLEGMDGSLESAKKKMEELTASQQKAAEQAASTALADAAKRLDEAYAELANGSLADGTRQVAKWRAANSDAIKDLISQAKNGTITYRQFDEQMTAMVESYAKANGRSAEWTRQMLEEVTAASQAVKTHGQAAATLANVAQATRDLDVAAQGAAGSQANLNAMLNGTTDAGQKAIAGLQRQIALYGKAGQAAGILYDIQQARQGKGEMSAFSPKELDELEKFAKTLKGMEGGKTFGKAQDALAYYEGLVAANADALSKIDAEERKALAENKKRRADDAANSATYAKAEIEIRKKAARDRAALEEQNAQEIAAANIQTMVSQEARIVAIREEAIRRADAAVKAGTRTVEQAERDKTVAIFNAEKEQAELRERLAQTNADNAINATTSEVGRIQMIWGEAFRRIDAEVAAGAKTFAQGEADKVGAFIAAQNAMRQAVANLDPVAQEQTRYAAELDGLRKLNEAKLIENQRYLELKTAAETAHEANLRVLREESFRAQSEWNNLAMNSVDALASTSQNLVMGMIERTTSLEDAARALGRTVLNEVVSSFVKMGVAQVKAWIIGKTAQAAAAAGYVASVGGQVAAQTALAAQAAFASTAAIPIVGPAMAPAAAAAAGSMAAALGAPAVAAAATTVAGSRYYGGGTQAGGLYRINEGGRPEVFNAANGQQYMLANQRGEVVSNADSSRTGGPTGLNVSVTFVEDASRGGEVQTDTMEDGGVSITAFVADIRRGGPASQALEGTYNLQRRGN